MLSKTNTRSGFTIVELLVVIVVIGILATISFVAYSGVQARARDTIRRNDLVLIKSALMVYNAEKKNWIETGSGCGYGGDGAGWFSRVDGGSYIKSVSNCLKEGGYIPRDITDPSGNTSSSPTVGFTYMKYHCGAGDQQHVYLYAKLESVPQSSTATDGTCSDGLDTSYGMNYVLKVL